MIWNVSGQTAKKLKWKNYNFYLSLEMGNSAGALSFTQMGQPLLHCL